MTLTSILTWILLGVALILLALAARAWLTLKEGQAFQEDLARLTNDQLHDLLSRSEGTGLPQDILFRLNALMEFERRGDPRLVPLYVALLKDPHPSVASVCLEALRERTGQDFRSAENDTLPDTEAWERWWRAHSPQS